MLESMTSFEFGETMAYASIEPFGEQREELRHGQMMHLLDRANFKRDKPLAISDFMNFIQRPEQEPLTPEEEQARIDREVLGL